MNEENKEQNAISKQFKEMQKKISKEYEHHAVLVKSEENS